MKRLAFVLAVLPLLACSTSTTGSVPCASSGGDMGGDAEAVVATIGDQKITMGKLDDEAAAALTKARSDLYNARKAALDKMIDDQLLQGEADKRGITTDELVKAEVDDKVGEPSEEEAKAYFDKTPLGARGRKYEEVAPRIKAYLQRQNAQTAREDFMTNLRSAANVTIALEPIRIQVKLDGLPTKGGPVSAPVQLVEYSDFQCPYCGKGKEILDQVKEKYGDNVHIAFADYPLPMHPEAPKAHEAANCAHDQGKFWEMHDKLFENQRALKPENLKTYAGELGLDQAKFDTCLDSGEKKAVVDTNMKNGRSVGVQGTPGFFVNGRFINGAQPIENFEKIIDEELQAKGIDPAKNKKG